MKKISIITRPERIKGFFTVLFLLLSVNIQAQKGIQIGFTLYPGYTAVNFEKALGYSDEYMNDWDQFFYSGSLKGFLTSNKKIHFGAEIALQRLYYAYYIVPYVPSPVYREFNISTISFAALARYSPDTNWFLLTGIGIHLFNDGVAPAILVEPGYSIRLGEKMKVPVSIRLNPIFGDGTPIPISLGVGLNYTLK